MEIVRQIGFRLSAGYDFEEVAVMLEAHRDDLQHNELPEGAIRSQWCRNRLREVRLEVARTHSDAPG